MIPSNSKQPNILLIMSDQHNANAIGYTGNSEVKTPNLDSLAEDGISFSNAYCNNPICAPSRTSFITGQYIHTHGLGGNDNRSLSRSNGHTLGSVIKNSGYETAFIGKSHTVPKWDKESYDFLKYNGFCDADYDDPLTCHYFKYLHGQNLSNYCVEGTENKTGFPEAFNGSALLI